MNSSTNKFPIGVFDSGFGGLSILKEFKTELPKYDFIYFGDNARAPYGTRSFESVYQYTWECVTELFYLGCPLVILACNTASAKALRSIQKNKLPDLEEEKKVLGVIRPTTEQLGNFSKTKSVGILGTPGTIASESYPIELKRFFPDLKVYQQSCPMWVPLIENNEINNPGADYFIKKNINDLINQDQNIDTVVLGCTHYPLIIDKIKKFLPSGIAVVTQGKLVAEGLKDYLFRHPEIEMKCSKNSLISFFTTDATESFNEKAKIFYGENVQSKHISL